MANVFQKGLELANNVNPVKQLLDKLDTLLHTSGTSSAISAYEQLDANYYDLFKKINDLKLSSVGTIQLDHITLYVDDLYDPSAKPNTIFQGIQKDGELTRSTSLKDKVMNTPKVMSALDRLGKKTFGNSKYEVVLLGAYINVSKSKVYSSKTIVGMDNPVDQLISNGQYKIAINTRIVGNNPYQSDMTTLKKLNFLLNLKQNLMINSIYLNYIFDIYELKVDSFDINDSTEYTNVSDITINCSTTSNNTISIECQKRDMTGFETDTNYTNKNK